MNINAKISLFRNYWDVTPVCELTIFQFYENIINSDYVNEVNEVRNGNKAVKKQLPGVTISGTFTKRNNNSLIKHSGFIAIDVDQGDNPNITDWEALRETLGSWEEVLLAALSVSGKGLFLIIPIAYPQKHREQFLALQKDFAAFGLTVDEKCKDISRLRGITSDSQATWNAQAKPYQKYIIEQPASHHKPTGATPELTKLIAWVERKHGIFTQGNRNNFLTQLTGACHRLGISQSEVENYCTSLAQSDFSEREIMSTIKSIYSNQSWRARATA